MPIKIPDKLPAADVLSRENIFFMTEERAIHQDIRPLKIGMLNLMPTKVATETQLLRLLSYSPLQIEIELIQTATYTSKNTSSEHLLNFYKTFDDVKEMQFDGFIITGAPVELMSFEDVAYWNELTTILDWAKTHVFSLFCICWGAQAALYHYYGLNKHCLENKLSGIFLHDVLQPNHPVLRGFDTNFYAPHSRNTYNSIDEISRSEYVTLLVSSKQAGAYILTDNNSKNYFITGHGEYDKDTLDTEFKRDLLNGLDPLIPCNYYENDDPDSPIPLTWRSHSALLFGNWLNIVYQRTPYNFIS